MSDMAENHSGPHRDLGSFWAADYRNSSVVVGADYPMGPLPWLVKWVTRNPLQCHFCMAIGGAAVAVAIVLVWSNGDPGTIRHIWSM